MGAAAALLLLSSPAVSQTSSAQQRDPWRLTGSLGLGYEGSDVTTNGQKFRTSRFGFGGTVGLHGFVRDPRFLRFDLGANLNGIDNDQARQEFSTRVAGLRLNTMWFSERYWPLTVRYARSETSSHGGDGPGRFELDSDYETLGVDWQLRLPRRPHFTFSLGRTSGSSAFPITGVASSDSTTDSVSASVSHLFKGWSLNGNYNMTDNEFSFSGGSDTSTELELLGANAQGKLGERTDLRFGGRWLDRQDSVAGRLGLGSQDASFNGTLSHRHGDRLSSSYTYHLAMSSFDLRQVAAGPALSRDLSFHDLGASFSYLKSDRLELFGSADVQLIEDDRLDFETPERLVRVGPGIRYRHPVGRFLLSTSYQPTWAHVVSSLDASASTWSHQFRIGAETGDPSKVHSKVEYVYSDLEQVTRIGAFDEQSSLRVFFTSSRLEAWTLRASAALVRVRFVNITGQRDSDYDNWEVAASHRLVNFSLGRRTSVSDGLAFSEPLSTEHPITEPLPIDLLVPAPLAGRTGTNTFFNARARLAPNLTVTASYLDEESTFVLIPRIDSRRREVSADYRLGKITIRAGYLLRDLEVAAQRTEFERFYVRVFRTFSTLPFLQTAAQSAARPVPPMASVLRRSGKPPPAKPAPPAADAVPDTAAAEERAAAEAAAREATIERAAAEVAAVQAAVRQEAAAREAAAERSVAEAAAPEAAEERVAAGTAARGTTIEPTAPNTPARGVTLPAAVPLAPRAGSTHRVVGAAEPCLSLRAEPDPGSPRLECLAPGSAIEVVDESGAWSRVRRRDGSYGWVASRFLEPAAAAPAVSTLRVSGSAEPCLTLRVGPDPGAARLECVAPGLTVEVLDRRDDWSRVRRRDGSYGWMVSRFLEPADGEGHTR